MMKKSIFLLFIFFNLVANAQTNTPPSDNSPYSRFGLGDFVNQNLANSAAKGNLSASFQDPNHLNLLNPAASSSLVTASYEIGINARFTTMADKVSSAKARNGGISYLALGFPLRNQVNELFDTRKKASYKLGMNFGLLPYTNVGYNILTTKTVENVGKTTYKYEGTGGLYKFYWGNSISYKDFSFGLNLGYLFGKINSNRLIQFDDLQNNYELQVTNKGVYRGFLWNLGAQYAYNFKKKGSNGKMEASGDKLIFGVYGNPSSSFTVNNDNLYIRENSKYFFNGAISRDSLLKDQVAIKDAKGTLPSELSLGVTYQKGTKFKVGVNYSTAAWSKYKNASKVETLSDTYRFGAGLEFTPDAASYNKYFNRVRYRMGVNVWNDPRNFKGTQLEGKSISVGFGFPLVMPRQQVSFVNLSLEAGSLGSEVLSQNYFKTTLGFTLNDNSWFYKRKYN
jgi:hypothetical protein